MPASLNKVFLIGNLTRDPELRYVPSGQAVAAFTVASNRAYNAPSGEKKEEVCFVRIVAWGRMAEVCNEYLKKGSQVFIEGRLQSRSWQAQDGSKRSTMEVVANNVQFLGRPSGKQDKQDISATVAQSSNVAAGKIASADVSDQGVAVSEDELVPDEDVPF